MWQTREEPRNPVRPDMRIEFWRLRIYSAGFLVAFALHLALNGIERPPALLVLSVVVIIFGVWKRSGPWLRAGVMLGILHALVFPVLQQAVANGEPIAAVVMRVPVWPQLLVTLIGSRVLATKASCLLYNSGDTRPGGKRRSRSSQFHRRSPWGLF